MIQRVAHRYRVVAPLAKGGLGTIYQVFDEVTQRAVAFKRLRLETVPERHRERVSIGFEREFFTLAQLAHPRVIEVYDYGVDEAGPYYTMELLGGVDLRERAPLHWRDACVVLRDVSSSLALLHSRRLLHHDISPRNVRCASDGHAKLIDFGAMGPFGAAMQLAGTPGYMAPETVYGQTLDARADLFGLGALAYFALTRKHAFSPTRTVDIAETWRKPPTPLRQLVDGLPIALENLIASLLSLDPMARPSSAAEVAGRLGAIAALPSEDLRVADAYLAAPAFTARQEPLAVWQQRLEQAILGRGRALLLLGEGGIGRSRFLSVAALQAQLAGAVSLTVHAAEQGTAPYSTVKALVEEIAQQRPDLMLSSWEPAAVLRACERACLVISVDDFEQCDAASATALAELALVAEKSSLLLTLAVRTESAHGLPRSVEPIAERCAALALQPLSSHEMVELLRSVFGDVPNLRGVAEWVQRLSRGNPGMAMASRSTWSSAASHTCKTAFGCCPRACAQWIFPTASSKPSRRVLPRLARQQVASRRRSRCSRPLHRLRSARPLRWSVTGSLRGRSTQPSMNSSARRSSSAQVTLISSRIGPSQAACVRDSMRMWSRRCILAWRTPT